MTITVIQIKLDSELAYKALNRSGVGLSRAWPTAVYRSQAAQTTDPHRNTASYRRSQTREYRAPRWSDAQHARNATTAAAIAPTHTAPR